MLRLTKVFVSPLSRTRDTLKSCRTLHAFEDYCEGRTPAHYPVPAPIIEYEWGRRWGDGSIVLLCATRGAYDG